MPFTMRGLRPPRPALASLLSQGFSLRIKRGRGSLNWRWLTIVFEARGHISYNLKFVY